MRKINVVHLLIIPCVLSACSKKDPVLQGVRQSIFENNDIPVLNTSVPSLPENIEPESKLNCPYTQDYSNIIWHNETKLFTGFATDNFINVKRSPVCHNGFVYAGLTTGEIVKINPKNKNIEWVADVFRDSNMTGGSSIIDIPAPVVIKNNEIYSGGLGDSFCKLSIQNGSKKWCVNIGVGVPFIVTDTAAFVVDTDNNLYAINTNDGAIYWKKPVKKQVEPKYKNHIIRVGHQKFNAFDGTKK